MATTVDGLIRKHAPLWRITIRNPFVNGVREGTLQRELFDSWLVQTHHLLEAHFAPVSRLLAAAPRGDRPMLLEGLRRICSELEFYRGVLAERDLDPSSPIHPAMLSMRNHMIALGFEPYVVGLVGFWTQGRTYTDAWTSKREPVGEYRDFLLRWGHRRAADWVRELGRGANRALADAPPRDRAAAEEAFLRVVQGKLLYWTAKLS